MGYVRGPFIAYECGVCGVTVHENAPRNADRLVDLIAERNANKDARICAGCWHPGKEPRHG